MNKKGQALAVTAVAIVTIALIGLLIYAVAQVSESSICNAMQEEGFKTKIKYIAGLPNCFIQDGDGRYIEYDKFRALTGD